MRLLTQQMMGRVFEVTDELEIDREAVTVPLALAGERKVERKASGKIEITLPDTDDLGPFLADLPARLRALVHR
jgi:hypothetical protein